MNKKKIILLSLDVLFLAILIVIDQVTKFFAVQHLKGSAPFEIWEGVFELKYLENRGAAFGMLQNQKVFFIFIASVILMVIAYVLVKAPTQNKYVKLHFALVLVAGGAIGNMIDRLRFDYVVDFLYFSLINFPIFNVADIYVTLASIFLVILLLFVYKESDLEFLSFRTKKFREVK
ncbi:MAG: signal peptidase II [Lachnospiraceae bacterium]|nr:signal peptidase II [Lachnospiraceae bacterium]